MEQRTVVLVETNGAEPETTTRLTGGEVVVVSIDWDEVERGDDPAYVRDILARIEELGVGEVAPPLHVGMPEVVRQLKARLAELGDV